jgi:hypothetical protein
VFGVDDMVRKGLVWSRRYLAAVRLLLPVVFVLGLAACRGPVQQYESLWPGVSNLRQQFNAEAGTVRILLLPAPT